jgi:hypothetical protein
MSGKCPICGKPTRIYMGHQRKDGLCGYHADLLNKGTILFIDGKYIYAGSGHPVIWGGNQPVDETSTSNSSNCIICGQPSNGRPLCHNDYEQVQSLSNSLANKYNNADDLIDYYRRLLNKTYKTSDEGIVKNNCIKLIAISITLDSNFNCCAFKTKALEDVKSVLDFVRKKPETVEIQPVINNIDSTTKHIDNLSQDHHVLDSHAEAEIDNILFELQKDPILLTNKEAPYHIPHVEVFEITERSVVADWCVGFPYFPEAVFYIEYYGYTNNPKYDDNRAAKEILYKKHNIIVLGIEADEIKNKNSLTNKIKEFIIKRVAETKK